MKLYAKTTAERGKTVGKGGNREIFTTLSIDTGKRKEIGRIVLRYGEAGEGDHEGYTVYYYPISENCKGQKIHDGRVLLFQEKTEMDTTEFLDWRKQVMHNKGEKQKGEQPTKGWNECVHYSTDANGLCVRCGYNTLHLPTRQLKSKVRTDTV